LTLDLNDVTAAWEVAAQSKEAQAHIHPSGNHGDEAYRDSGAGQADYVAAIAAGYLVGNHGPVVDFGCGDGRVLEAMLGWFSGKDLWGADASATMLERLKGRIPTVNAILTNGVDGGLDALEPSLIYSWAVFIHHNHRDGAALLGALGGSLRPGGLLALQIPLYRAPTERGGWCDVSVWTEEMLADAARDAGLEIVEMTSSPGVFDYAAVGVNHGALQILRRPS